MDLEKNIGEGLQVQQKKDHCVQRQKVERARLACLGNDDKGSGAGM